MFYIYVLQSLKDETFYVGYTKDVTQRLKSHNLGKVRYTKGHLPYKLVYTETYITIGEAKSREKEIKTLKNTQGFLKKQTGSPDRTHTLSHRDSSR